MDNGGIVRVLLLGDTHLGFDLPTRPRIQRRRRGHDFFAAFERALAPALRGHVDLVVHGGDLLYRSKVPKWLVGRAMEPIFAVADRGVPVFIVPGNHERSRIPYPLLTVHPHVHIFDRPRTFSLRCSGTRINIAGFPFARRVEGRAFAELLAATRWDAAEPADIVLLCMHQAVEGACVGVQDFTFRSGPDVIAGRDVPSSCDAVLSGHIHRAQLLTHDLRGRPLAAPVVYPGSTERTSLAERREPKGYCLLELHPRSPPSRGRGWVLKRRRFVQLPTRPMVLLEVDVNGLGPSALTTLLSAELGALDPEAIVKLKPRGTPREEATDVLSAASLRALAPVTMNVDLSLPRFGAYGTLSRQ